MVARMLCTTGCRLLLVIEVVRLESNDKGETSLLVWWRVGAPSRRRAHLAAAGADLVAASQPPNFESAAGAMWLFGAAPAALIVRHRHGVSGVVPAANVAPRGGSPTVARSGALRLALGLCGPPRHL